MSGTFNVMTSYQTEKERGRETEREGRRERERERDRGRGRGKERGRGRESEGGRGRERERERRTDGRTAIRTYINVYIHSSIPTKPRACYPWLSTAKGFGELHRGLICRRSPRGSLQRHLEETVDTKNPS